MPSVACIIATTAKRTTLMDEVVMPSVIGQGFSEVVVLGAYHSGANYRHLPVAGVTRSTVDAQRNRDIGTMATVSEWLVYLTDDHRLGLAFVARLHDLIHQTGIARHDIVVPTRFTTRNDRRVPLPMGVEDGYCAGHAGVFHRTAIQEVPWSVAPAHPNWDLLHSGMLLSRGYQLYPTSSLMIEDVEPGATPWV